MIELLTYYVIVSVVFIGAPGVFFFIVFMPALQNTKGRMVGYKDHKTYGDSSIYENTPSDNTTYTPYKLAEIIRDTWPQLYYLKKQDRKDGRFNTTTTNKGVVRCP